jgi:ABC-type polysaccharide/polyol phosphate transport system ATPase subunit
MSTPAVVVDDLWKNFRLYHERNQFLKASILRGRRARYDEFWALKGLSFEVPTGGTIGVIGSNGSGKSTLLKTLAGILIPDKGTVSTKGRLSALLELGAGFHPELSGRENVFLNGAILGLKKNEIEQRFDSIVEFAGLEQFIDTPVKNYSSGMFVRLGFAVAANVEPDILLIDEVLSVGDESFQRRSAAKIDEFRRDGRTIIFVSHGLDQVEHLCETVAWIDRGELKRIGPAGEVISEYRGDSHGARIEAGELGARWGSGDAEIVSVTFTSPDGEPIVTPRSGDPIDLVVQVTQHRPIDDLVLLARIDEIGGHTIWHNSSRRVGLHLAGSGGDFQITVSMPSLPLLDGTYELTLGLTNHTESEAYDWWERRIQFEVKQFGVVSGGIIDIPAQWEIVSSSKATN